MDWNNVNLNDNYEADQNIIDPLSFNNLLLEISCNIKNSEINEATVMQQFEADLQSCIDTAREIMRANINNITNHAKKNRIMKYTTLKEVSKDFEVQFKGDAWTPARFWETHLLKKGSPLKGKDFQTCSVEHILHKKYISTDKILEEANKAV